MATDRPFELRSEEEVRAEVRRQTAMMRRRRAPLLAAVALACFIIGVALWFSPMYDGATPCGTGWSSTDLTEDCERQVRSVRLYGVVLFFVSAVFGFAALEWRHPTVGARE
ncbi:MAG: hypothetical protein AAF548_11265 [Actinomycetota bacterium]